MKWEGVDGAIGIACQFQTLQVPVALTTYMSSQRTFSWTKDNTQKEDVWCVGMGIDRDLLNRLRSRNR